MIMEAEKSHRSPSASWRPKKAGSVIQSESKGLRSRGADGVRPSPSPKTIKPGEDGVPAQAIE